MTIYLNDNIRNNLANALRGYLSNATCQIFAGDRLPDPDYPPLTDPLVEFPIGFNSATDGKFTLSNAPRSAEVLLTGTAAWFRISYNSYAVDGDVSESGGAGDLILSSTALVAGEMAALTQLDFEIPKPA